MKRFLLTTALCVVTSLGSFAQMSDAQVMRFIAREKKAGTSQAQIVTKLMQRGVLIEQIRRIRNQYDSQINSGGVDRAAEGAVSMPTDRMEGNGDGTVGQEVVSGRLGTTSETYADPAEEHATAERDVLSTQNVKGDVAGKKVFGRDIFNQRALSFSPNLNVPTPTDYILGAGDQIVVDIFGDSQKTLVNTISNEGTVTISGIGPVNISGLTVAAAQRKIRSRLGKHYSGSNFRLTLGQTRSIMIHVMGEVSTPGTYHMSPFATVFHALYTAGGIGDLGTLQNIKVFRSGRLISAIDIYEYILNGRLAGNIRLQDEDVIQVGALGNTEALYPMLYPELMEGTDFKISLFDVLVHKKDSTRMMRYYDYLLKEQKSPWWSPVINAPFRLIGALWGSKEEKKEQPFDAFRLTKIENQIVKSLDNRVFCEVDNKTFIITINVVDQDPYIAACMADTIKHRLQDFITDYRTKKARVDLEHTRKLYSEAKERYEKARRLYAEYADANQDIIYQTARIKLTELENDMQLKYNIFVSLSTQLQGAEAMVQEETPAFTTLQSATVPVQKSGPKRTKKCLIYLFLAFLGTTVWVLYKENQLKSLFGFN